MQMYLTLASIPELSGLARADAVRIWRSTCWRALLHWQTYVGFALTRIIHEGEKQKGPWCV